MMGCVGTLVLEEEEWYERASQWLLVLIVTRCEDGDAPAALGYLDYYGQRYAGGNLQTARNPPRQEKRRPFQLSNSTVILIYH